MLNVGVSRLAHPATLGALALAKHTGAKFNPIPLSGGKNNLIWNNIITYNLPYY